MTTCSSCGARLGPADLICQYCNARTEAGTARVAQEERERQAEARRTAEAAEAARRNLATAAVATARRALRWSLLGFVICLVPALIACVLAWKARALARLAGVPTPSAANYAFAISGVYFAILAGFVTFGVTDDRRVTREKADLAATIGAKDKSPTMDHDTACAMVHLRLLEQGYAGVSGNLISNFDCPGKVVQIGDSSSVDDVRFKTSATGPLLKTVGCLKREERWLVDAVQDNECPFVSAHPPTDSAEAHGTALSSGSPSKTAKAHHHDAGAMVQTSLSNSPTPDAGTHHEHP